MTLLRPSLLQKLARSRLMPRAAAASSGVGERRSRGKGPGIEFADHRLYQPGDDTRHLDRHVYARLGTHVIKQFSLYQQLRITVLLDASASMAYGTPSKFERARELAGGLAWIGLAGGDDVLVGAMLEDRVRWYARLQGGRRAQGLFHWLTELRPAGATDLRAAVRASVPRLIPGGLLIVVGDFLADGVADALAAWHGAGQELLAVQVLAPEELEPERLGPGAARLADAETGDEVRTPLDGDALRRYHTELRAWLDELRGTLHGQEGRHLLVRSDDDLEHLLLTEWRRSGLVR